MCLCIIFARFTVSAGSVELVDQTNISADSHQLRFLLSVCLALDFIQDQEPVKKGPLGGTEHCSDCQSEIVDFFFVSFWMLWLLS